MSTIAHSSVSESCNVVQPLVTVITATYNLIKAGRADYIRECINSVHTQTYPNIEHLIIDGASSDGTLELLDEYVQKGWVILHSEPDKGLYEAFNKGLLRANGKYIAFLNSDDFWHDSRGVEESVRQLEKHQADFSYAPYHSLKRDGKPRKVDTPICAFIYTHPICHQSMLTRTDLLRSIGGFNMDYKVCADRDVMIRLFLTGAKPAYVPLCFTTFRAGGFSETFGQGNLAAHVHEHALMYRNNFAPLIADEQQIDAELEQLQKDKLTSSFKNALKARLHPSIYKELNLRCQWDKNECVWRFYQGHRTAPFVSYHAMNMLIRILNLIVPRWLDKWKYIRKSKRL